MTAPDILRLTNGRLSCADGRNMREYLRDWAKDNGHPAHTPVCIIGRDELQEILDELALAREYPLGA